MMTQDKKIENCGPESGEVLGWTVQKGYVFRVVAEDSSTWDCSREYDLEDGGVHIEKRRFGYHGNDVPPCGASYLYAGSNGELLVIASESDPAQIDTVDGFTLEPVILTPGEYFHDGTWSFRVLDVNSNNETTIVGRC